MPFLDCVGIFICTCLVSTQVLGNVSDKFMGMHFTLGELTPFLTVHLRQADQSRMGSHCEAHL